MLHVVEFFLEHHFLEKSLELLGFTSLGGFLMLVLFRHMMKSTAPGKLTSEHQFSLLRMLLILTFAFAVICVGFTVYFELHKPEAKKAQHLKTLEARHASGERIFDDLSRDSSLPDDQRKQIEKVRNDYRFVGEQMQQAWKADNYDQYHDLQKRMDDLFHSDDAHKVIPKPDLDKLQKYSVENFEESRRQREIKDRFSPDA